MYSFTDDESTKVIIKLNRDTASGKIKWNSIFNPDITLAHDGEIVGKIYRTPFRGKYFQIYKFKYKTYSEEFNEMYHTSDIKLEIVDNRGEQEWEFANDNILTDLYETVRYKSSNVDEMLNSFLNDE